MTCGLLIAYGGGPFFTELSQAYDPNTIPIWCSNPLPNLPGAFNPVTQVWQIYGYYQDVVAFYPDSNSHWNQDSLDVAEPVLDYLNSGTNATIPSSVFSILENILDIDHGIDNEASIINLVKLMEKLIFAINVEQQPEGPSDWARVELVYTSATALGHEIPLARHTYLQVTAPDGDIYVTRAGPSLVGGGFGSLVAQSSTNPQSTLDFKDLGVYVHYRQFVGYTLLSEQQIELAMSSFSDAVTVCDTPYGKDGPNSNTYAFTAAEEILLFVRPKPIGWAPGWNNILPCP